MSFWDGSKVSGTKKRNKTTGAYSGIPGDDMRGGVLKAKRNARTWSIGGQPLAVAMCGGASRESGLTRYV
ncbi:prephenate dehydrogenase [Paraburkholderia dipogonis]|uniref:Prephenate dehydrogenase n=1 Tax=Paraburkholderia dipogonis TaxID=1211383 RepID=A0A4Y8NC46_9BURK|nr:prephenate dehydrogenase [Paraburkholderia dipogonis]